MSDVDSGENVAKRRAIWNNRAALEAEGARDAAAMLVKLQQIEAAEIARAARAAATPPSDEA